MSEDTTHKTEQTGCIIEHAKCSVLTMTIIASQPFVAVLLVFTSILATHRDNILPEELLLGLLYSEVFCALCLLLCWWKLKNLAKAVLICSMGVFSIFSFRLFYIFVWGISIAFLHSVAPKWLTLVMFGVVVATLVSALNRDHWKLGFSLITVDHNHLCLALSAIMFALLLINGIPVSIYDIDETMRNNRIVNLAHRQFDKAPLRCSGIKPDVYYIILDAYGHTNTLKSYWDYDNSRFITFLESKGFFVAARSHSNYDRTIFSIPSSLNMQFLDDFKHRPNMGETPCNTFARLNQNNSVQYLLKKAGYKFINVSSSSAYCGTDYVPNACQNYRPLWGGELTQMLFGLTPLYAIEEYFSLLRESLAATRLAPTAYLDEVVPIPGPKFVLLHSCLSHPPFIFGRNGSKTKLDLDVGCNVGSNPALYVNQLNVAEREAEKWIDTIMAKSSSPPVIIIQSDHGPWFKMSTPTDYYNERMRILNAYYFPNTQHHNLYDSISPVNSFRVFFNDYFNAGLPLLKDDAFCPPDNELRFQWDNVTSKLAFPVQ